MSKEGVSVMLIELTSSNYNETISTDLPLVVEFYSPTCVHCKRLEGALGETSEKVGSSAIIAKCDITSQTSLAQMYDITALPTLLFIKNGDVKNKLTGEVHKLVIAEEIKKLQ